MSLRSATLPAATSLPTTNLTPSPLLTSSSIFCAFSKSSSEDFPGSSSKFALMLCRDGASFAWSLIAVTCTCTCWRAVSSWSSLSKNQVMASLL